MSRIGRKPIFIPEDVKVKIEDNIIYVKGPKGELKQDFPSFLKVEIKHKQLKVSVKNPESKKERSLWGTFARLISNMVQGVTQGFEKKLELVGVGYRAKISGDKLILDIGFSHSVEFLIPAKVELKVEQNIIIIQGIDKQLVGEVAAQIRRLKKPEPYKGKGIRYVGEIVRRKAGKRVATTSA